MELQEYLVSSLTEIPAKELSQLRQSDVRTVLYQAPVHAQIVGIQSFDGQSIHIEKVNKLGAWNFNKPMPYQKSLQVWEINGIQTTVEQLISIVLGYNTRYMLTEAVDLDKVPKGNKQGKCFQIAAEIVLRDPSYTLVHGIPTGQGAIQGLQYGHAWVEKDDEVRDDTVGQDGIVLPKIVYYAIGNIKYTKTYSHKETLEKLLETENWGPWDEKILKACP